MDLGTKLQQILEKLDKIEEKLDKKEVAKNGRKDDKSVTGSGGAKQ